MLHLKAVVKRQRPFFVCGGSGDSNSTGLSVGGMIYSAQRIEIYGETEMMSDFSIGEMLTMQHILQEKYKDKWEAICPEAGKHKLLWMIGEIGEVIDIIKKNGDVASLENSDLRKHLVEEMADVLMYYNDVLLCYGISEEELKEAYTTKFKKNMERW